LRAVAARLLVLALAAVAVAVSAHALRADDRCTDVKARARTAPRAELAAIADETAARCGDPRDSAVVTLVLTARGRRATALGLARRMTSAHPDDYLGWLIVWRLSGDRRAHARAEELNPRGTPS
jgi:hypothetical protein